MSQTDCSHITRYPSDHGRRKDFFQGGALGRGATSSSFCGGGNFHEISFNDVIVLNRGTTFSQTVTMYSILPADTKSIVYKQTHSAKRWLIKTKQNVLQQRWSLNHWCQAKFLTCEISDSTPYAHAQSKILRTKYTEKTDD